MSQEDAPLPVPEPADSRLTELGDPRMTAMMTALGMHKTSTAPPITVNDSREALHAYYGEFEKNMKMLGGAVAELPESPLVEVETVTIKGMDGNDVNLHIHTPKEHTGPLPCIYHIHGGGMAMMSTLNLMYVSGRNLMALKGFIVIGVEFRNCTGELGPHPFPAGLNDVMSGLQWVHDNRAARNISQVILSGESGGGNLSLACCLRAKKEQKLDQIDGVYAMCPYIYGRYGHGDSEDEKLPSLSQFDGLFLLCADMQCLASLYLTEGADARSEPLAWPYWASDEDLSGLPPHVISVNELDPLKDEGIAYYHKLLRAGVRARMRVVGGTVHAGDLIFSKIMPDVSGSTLSDLVSFSLVK